MLQNAQRLEAVMAVLRGACVARVLDLGCGPGPLLLRLAQADWAREVVGLDVDPGELKAAQAALDPYGLPDGDRLRLVQGDLLRPDARLAGFDAAALVETVEHIDPGRLSALEHGVFAVLRPGLVVVTTPNADYNPLYGRTGGRFRHPDHRFEWSRVQLRTWAGRVAAAHGYSASLHDIGPAHPRLGTSSQMAVFRRVPAGGAAPVRCPVR
ncbi:methyltransferase domain-containing protein [Rhodovibrio salinarum]|uniref:methyltransferase domain-containing protein n=1 Tax=Rhodovibrio salinarum TaxID=1087 RepID=UPI0004812B29|nr:methyltransferase domain-containing protein [Rhodovibrio salinarum]